LFRLLLTFFTFSNYFIIFSNFTKIIFYFYNSLFFDFYKYLPPFFAMTPKAKVRLTRSAPCFLLIFCAFRHA